MVDLLEITTTIKICVQQISFTLWTLLISNLKPHLHSKTTDKNLISREFHRYKQTWIILLSIYAKSTTFFLIRGNQHYKNKSGQQPAMEIVYIYFFLFLYQNKWLDWWELSGGTGDSFSKRRIEIVWCEVGCVWQSSCSTRYLTAAYAKQFVGRKWQSNHIEESNQHKTSNHTHNNQVFQHHSIRTNRNFGKWWRLHFVYRFENDDNLMLNSDKW